MNTLILSLLFVGASLTTAVAQSDEAPIKNVIDAQKKAADAADYKTYKSCWANVPYASFLIYGGQIYGDSLWQVIDRVWATRKPIKMTNTRTNWNICTKGETAYVTFTQRSENHETKTILESAEARYLEKVNGQWKIVSVVAMFKP
ncbi:nuclear transport factor 2 family protein [Spirosoma sp. BT702]|uniref:Nuclear transport factor 2 family protein n=1 Tax=Spirosoma profusum TaxID=2771354 RepID=A0A926Y446_9BACT|nr:nuclear transport factor 2 family protein [Spirosoma profusum]MBD2702725.1 nuclear transport factor 2 family protein [Spirosoma profusum]